jgi:N-sulfoglucosamine sulfohydrolase
MSCIALYRLTDDPTGVRNLANDLAFAQTLEDMRYKMMNMLKDEQDPRALGNGAIFDTYKYLGGRAKGYETWLKAQEEKLAEMIKVQAEQAATKKATTKGKKK